MYIGPCVDNFVALEDVYVVKFMGDIIHKVTVMDSAAEESGFVKFSAENNGDKKEGMVEMEIV